jgi:hypothetical protein
LVPFSWAVRAELGHGDDRDVFHPVAEVLVKTVECECELAEKDAELAGLIAVMVPAADLGERGFNPDIGFDQTSQLLQTAAELSALGVQLHLGLVEGLLLRLLGDGTDHLHCGKRVPAGAAEARVGGGTVHAFEHAGLAAHLERHHIADRDGGALAAQGSRHLRGQCNGADRRRIGIGGGQRAVHPAVGAGLAGGAGFHVILCVEVGARRVGRAGGVDDGELLLVPQRLQRLECRVESEAAVEVDRALGPARLRDRNGGAELVISLVREWGDHVQPVGRAALENRDQDFALGLRGRGGAPEPHGRGSGARHHYRRTAEEDPSSQHIATSFGNRASQSPDRR